MKIAGTIENILHEKGRNVWSITPDMIVFDAIKVLAEKNVGALLVMEGDKLVGMFSERDYTRKIILKGRASKETRVGEVVSSPVFTVSPEHSIEDCMRVMTEHRVRHLPVVHQDKVVGVVSIGDLVNWIITAQSAALEQMHTYIAGGYPT